MVMQGDENHVNRSWKHVDQTFWDEMACEAVQELKAIQDESLHEEHLLLFVDNVFRDVEKMWKVEMVSDDDDDGSTAQSPSPRFVIPSSLLLHSRY